MKKLEKYLPLLVLIAFLPILIFRDFSISNELRYLSIVDEALRDGRLFTFTNNGLPYADKPPLYLWIVMAGKLIFGQHHMWFIGLFSLLPALVIMRVMRNWIVADCALPEKEWRLTSQLMLITCGMFLGLNVFVRMDTLMCLFIVLALRTFYRMYQGRGDFNKQSFLFGSWVFLAVFTKGPVGILMPLLCPLAFLLFKREGRTFFHYWNVRVWAVLLLLCGLWFLAVYLEGGTEYLENLLFHQTRDRAINAFHHKKPFYYYLVQIWPSLAPYSLLLAGVWISAMFKHRFTSDTEYFWSTVVLTTFVMLSVVSGKLAVYLAPLIPFLVFLTVSLLRKFQRSPWINAALAIPAIVFVLALPALFLVAGYTDLAYLGQTFFYVAAGILSVAGIWALCRLFDKKNYKQQGVRKAVDVMGFSLLLAAFAGGWSVPAVNSYLGYGDVCRQAVEIKTLKGLDSYHSLYLRRAENMDVFLGEDIRQIPTADTVDVLREVKGLTNTVLVVHQRKLEKKASPALKQYLSTKESHSVGPYRIVVLQGDSGHDSKSVFFATFEETGVSPQKPKTMKTFQLPPLPYAENALEPFISAQTLSFHYGKHHKTYVDNLNKLKEGTPFEDAGIEEIIEKAEGGLYNNAAQVWNHTFYWNCLSPKGGGEPEGKLAEAIVGKWGSFEAFKTAFSGAAAGLFGSGWVWLADGKDGLEIIATPNAGNPLRDGKKPVMVIDVWEHAYYLDKQNRRPDYIADFWKIVDWKTIGGRY